MVNTVYEMCGILINFEYRISDCQFIMLKWVTVPHNKRTAPHAFKRSQDCQNPTGESCSRISFTKNEMKDGKLSPLVNYYLPISSKRSDET